MVLFSLIGPLRSSNHQLWLGDKYADKPLAALEWRMVADLDVEVVTDMSVPFERVLEAIKAVGEHAYGVFVRWEDMGVTVPIRWCGKNFPVHLAQPDESGTLPVNARQLEFARRVTERLRKSLH